MSDPRVAFFAFSVAFGLAVTVPAITTAKRVRDAQPALTSRAT